MSRVEVEVLVTAGGARESGLKDELIAAVIEHERVLSRAYARQRAGPLFDTPLTMQQARVLLLVRLEPGTTGHDVAAMLGVSQATVSGIVDRLVSHELLHRAEDPDDRRVRRLRLTDRAEGLFAQVEGAGVELRGRLLGMLDVDMLADLERILAELARRWRLSADGPGGGSPGRDGGGGGHAGSGGGVDDGGGVGGGGVVDGGEAQAGH